MPGLLDFLLAGALFLAAMLYASVGHGGASGYLAMMGLFSVSASLMRPSALILNVVVASIGLLRFTQATPFIWRLFLPFAITSIPCAYFGGQIQLSGHWQHWIIGGVLLYAAGQMLIASSKTSHSSNAITTDIPLRPPHWFVASLIGAVLGLLSGLAGVGGGIFLSPLIVLLGWASVRDSAAPVAAFILVNSIAGLFGLYQKGFEVPTVLPLWIGSVILGGWLGSTWGSRYSQPKRLRQALALVLAVAGIKLLLM